MSTYLELVRELVAELGIGGANSAGTVPETVLGQSGQLWNAVNWIKQAHNNLCLLHPDWEFLLVDYSESLTVGERAPPAHSGSEAVRKWDRTSFWLNKTLTSARQLEWVEWNMFRTLYDTNTANLDNTNPSIITIKPDRTLLLESPPDDTYAITGVFWRRPPVLAADDDTPAIPQEYHRLIVCEAAIKYGNKEAAIEVIQGMTDEYAMLLEGLEADYLPMRDFDRMGAADVDLVMEIPGYPDDLRTR